MTKLWTIPSLFLATGLLVVACAPAEPEDTSDGDEGSIVSSLPLSEGCSACAVDEIGSTCEAALDACAGNEDCLDPQACFAGCQPDDAACFAGCAAASALFDDLVECVVCDACADSCQGEWTCGGGDPDDDDGDDDCDQNQDDCDDAGNDPECPDDDPNCGDDGQPGDGGDDQDPECPDDDPNCGDDGQPGDDEGDPDGCQEDDANCDPDGGEDPGCDDGSDDCQPGEDEGGEGSACLSCVHQDGAGQCGDVVEACLSDEGCNHFVECVHDCGDDAQCATQCGQENESSDLVHHVLDCVLCGPCQDACAVELICG